MYKKIAIAMTRNTQYQVCADEILLVNKSNVYAAYRYEGKDGYMDMDYVTIILARCPKDGTDPVVKIINSKKPYSTSRYGGIMYKQRKNKTYCTIRSKCYTSPTTGKEIFDVLETLSVEW